MASNDPSLNTGGSNGSSTQLVPSAPGENRGRKGTAFATLAAALSTDSKEAKDPVDTAALSTVASDKSKNAEEVEDEVGARANDDVADPRKWMVGCKLH